MSGFFKIKGVVQHYAWGGYTFIPALLGKENHDNKPYAEYWLGAHPNHPSKMEDETSLADYIVKNPLPEREKNHGIMTSIPFLLKILDVRDMLSIQVHPGKKAALEGFEKEEKAGIPVNAAERNYKDRNHKPELMVALGDFYLLHGFKSPDKIKHIIHQIPELNFLEAIFKYHNYQALYQEVMRMPQEKVNAILSPLGERLSKLYADGVMEKNSENFWAARAITTFCKNGQYDRGIFSIYLFNLVCLKKGQGIFQDHGLPHAYLEGQNVEVMANSDNVLRAGLTEKNINVEELLKHVRYEPTDPCIIQEGKAGHYLYPSPAIEFELHHYEGENAVTIDSEPGEILMLVEGEAQAKENQQNIHLKKGEALFVRQQSSITFHPAQNLSLYRVLIPVG